MDTINLPDRVAQEVRRVAKLSERAVAKELSDLLGLRLTAAIGGVTETRRVHDWIEHGNPRRYHALKAALQATVAIASVYDAAAARAWFTSANPSLMMRSPLAFVRDALDFEHYDRLVTVAAQDI
jgi:hypothetical protein